MQDIGYASLAADILHVGHIRYISKCSRRCKRLIIGIMTDKAIIDYKGQRPIIPYRQRKEILQSIKGVWKTIPQRAFMPLKQNIKIDIYFDSEEHKRKPATVLFKRTKNISSTAIKEKIKKQK
jgi:glycerol-3-phosphate cytidylyltransferase